MTDHFAPAVVTRARLVLVDDHTILREGLRALLELEPDFEVVGEAGSTPAAIAIARQTKPDLIITDLSLPCSTGAQGIAELRLHCPDTKLLVLTVHNTNEHVRAALAAGANGYVLKDASRVELLHAARVVLSGERHLCSKTSARMLRVLLREEASRVPAPMPHAVVTGRERQIVALVASGASTKRIAVTLSLSVKTVEKHRSNVMRKLGLRNVAGVTRFAIDSGLVARDGTIVGLDERDGRGDAPGRRHEHAHSQLVEPLIPQFARPPRAGTT